MLTITPKLVRGENLQLTSAKVRGKLSAGKEADALEALRQLPNIIHRTLQTEGAVTDWSAQFAMRKHALFLGRGIHYPIAMEGAMKLKEISYIHA